MICPSCSLPTDRWPFCKPGTCMLPTCEVPERFHAIDAPAHPKERCVVYMHPESGEVRYPGTNDAPMPKLYREQGYVRHELPTLRSIEKFEKEQNVRSEIAWFDSGSGRGHEYEGVRKRNVR